MPVGYIKAMLGLPESARIGDADLSVITVGPLLAQSASTWVWAGVGLLIGAALVFVWQRMSTSSRLAAAKRESEHVLEEARSDADVLRKKAEVDAKAEFLRLQEELQKERDATRAEFRDIERRLAKREDTLEAKMDTLDSKERRLEQQDRKLVQQSEALARQQAEMEQVIGEQRQKLLRISGMTADEARHLLLMSLENELAQERATMIQNSVSQAKEEAASRSRDIILTAIQRYSAEHTAEATVSTIDIPNDEMKGRVIGREGRNIRAFERATGVDVIVDDTPGIVLVSAFDPVRREIARIALDRLVHDGRIHPGRIEELVASVTKEVETEIAETGKKASLEANVSGLHAKQLDLLGRLRYRTSYGQNVLRHSIEVAYLCQVIADELGLDGRLARRCGLLHDIGKAIDREVEGAHPKIGADFCRKFNEKPEVLNAIEGHHGDVPSTSPYTVIVMAADAISAARPGGRRESLERYVQRLQQLEEIAKTHDGVSEVYAIQAGREVRVIVDARRVDDAVATVIARDIAEEIEKQMTYPGEIKVTVLREVRAVAVAK